MADGPRVAIRLGVVGDAEVKATLDAIGETGEASAKRAGNAYARASKDVEDALARQAKAAQQVDAVLATAGAGGRFTGDQNAQVKAYQQYMADQQRQAEALRNAIDPVRVAQAAYDNELAKTNLLLHTGNITEAEHAAAVALSNRTLQEAKARLSDAAEGHGKLGASGMIAEHAVRSLSDSIAAGQSPVRAFAMESGRLVEAMTLWAQQSGETEGRMGKLAAVLSGPWGLALNLGIGLISVFAGKLFEGGEAADANARSTKSLADAVRELDEASRKQIRTAEESAQASLNDAKAKAAQAVATYQAAMASLRQWQALEEDPQAQPEVGTAGAIMASRAQAQVTALMDTILTAQDSVRRLELPILEKKVAAATDDSAAATQRYEARLARLRSELVAGTISQKQFNDQLVAATKLRDLTTDAHPKGPVDHSAEKAARAYQVFLSSVSKDWGEIENANRAFEKSFASDLPEQLKKVRGQMDADQKDRMAPGQYVVGQLAGQQDALAMSQAELATVGMNADQRQRILDVVAKTLELQRSGTAIDSDGAKAVLAGVAAQDRMNEAIARSSASMQEVRDFASQFVDDLTSGKNVVKDLQQEFIKLALLNPLKNLISGGSAPTLVSAFGSISKLFGGKGASVFGTAPSALAAGSAPVSIPGFASGTDYAPGGLAWIAENGPELVRLPRGASVTPAAQTRRMMAANDQGGGGGTTIHVYANDAVLADTVKVWVQQGMAAAAVQGAHGGAQLAAVNTAKRSRYRIPGR